MRFDPFTVDDVIGVLAHSDLHTVQACGVYGSLGVPECVAGHVVHALDPALFKLLVASYNNVSFNELPPFVLRSFTPNAIELLRRLQGHVDGGASWGEALRNEGWSVTPPSEATITFTGSDNGERHSLPA